MKKFFACFVIFCFMSSLVGCATNTAGEKAGVGAGIGAGLGAIIGGIVGGERGALIGAGIGAAVGGLAGYGIGKYEENQKRTKAQVYQDYPEYSEKSTAPEPDIKDLEPALLDSKDHLIGSFKGGQKVKMTSEYTIVASPDIKTVDVIENNYLVMPDGTQTPDAIRNKKREVQRVEAKQSITLPKELVPGHYTHVAIVKIGDKVYKQEQPIEVAATYGWGEYYVLNLK